MSHRHHSYKMQNDYDLYGNIDIFTFELIEETNINRRDLLKLEEKYIKEYNSYNDGYNCCEYATNPKYTAKKYEKRGVVERYVQIPKDIIYDNSINEKRVMVFTFLCCRKSLDDTVALSISEICNWSKMKINRQPGKINDKYMSVLSSFIDNGYFYDTQNIKNTSLNVNTYYRLDFNMDKYYETKRFAIIYFDEIKKVINFKEELSEKNINIERLTSSYIFLVLAYLRVNMNRNPDKPMCCYRFYEKIAQDIGISERYIGRVVSILDDLKIIKYKETPRTCYKNKQGQMSFNTGTKVFADYKHYNSKGEEITEYDCDLEIKKQIDMLSNGLREELNDE